MYRKLPIKTNIGKLNILPVNRGKFYSKHVAGGGIEYPLPTDVNKNTVELSPWEDSYSYYFNRALRHFIGNKRVRAHGNNYPGLHCDEAGWVDIMEFLHYDWIYDHEKVRTEDDGLIDSPYLQGGPGQLDYQDCLVRIPEDKQGSNSVPLRRPGLQLH